MGPVVKDPPANVGDERDVGSIPGSGRSPGVGNGNSLQYSCLGNPMDRGAWQDRVHRVTKVGHSLETEHACILNTKNLSFFLGKCDVLFTLCD